MIPPFPLSKWGIVTHRHYLYPVGHWLIWQPCFMWQCGKL